jgi:lysine 2,3-aminomutase
VVLRNYEGIITTYKEPDNYKTISCKKNCSECDLKLKTNEEKTEIGVEKLLTEADKTISLIPNGNVRLMRREKTNQKRAAYA